MDKIESGDKINFSGIYDLEEDSPAVEALIKAWKRDLIEAVAQYVIDELNRREQIIKPKSGTKNTKL